MNADLSEWYKTELAAAMAEQDKKENCVYSHGYGCTKCYPNRGPIRGLFPKDCK